MLNWMENSFLMRSFLNFVNQRKPGFILSLFAVAGVLSACNYISTRDVQRPVDDPRLTNQKLTANFDSIYEQIFVKQCISCHSPGKPAHQVMLDKDSLMKSPLDLIIPGNIKESGLVVAIEREDERRMPPPKDGFAPLKPQEILTIKEWIKNGAKD